MEFKFDAHQDYQLRAIQAVIDLFDGQPYRPAALEFEAIHAAVANQLELNDAALLANLQKVQLANGLPPDTELFTIGSFYNFSVEMETGTGKTYVYLRTALELARQYGLRKFIIVVPSVAIREGVLKTLEITERHFRELLNGLPYRYYVYDSANLARVRQFALSDSVEFMVMTIDSFNKDLNVIRRDDERLMGEIPLQLIQATRPILILDEPQTKMESENNQQALATLNPLLALRYSATHKVAYNRVYRLTPFEAYRQGLVKRIEINAVIREHDANQAYIKVLDIQTKKRTVTAKLAVHKLLKNGKVKEEKITVRQDEALFEKTDLPQYRGWTVQEIKLHQKHVIFSNGHIIELGASIGGDQTAIIAAQIRATVQEHLYKQRLLRERGIKVLTLFFVDRVANYVTEAGEKGIIQQFFEQAFDELKTHYSEWGPYSADQVAAAYFARGRKAGQDVFEDSTTGETRKDVEAYNLIMRDKERLLSFEAPQAFIFSHSALNEGWDNPNIFQICTLRQVGSEISRRQQIGRGVRLAVNQQGERIRDKHVNVLTVIANESYQQFVSTYQSEVVAEYGREGLPPLPANARQRQTVRRQSKYFELNEDFRQLWDKIKHKTRYQVDISMEQVLADVVEALNQAPIAPPRIILQKAQVEVTEDGRMEAHQTHASQTMAGLERAGSLSGLIDLVVYLLGYTTPPMLLGRQPILQILRATSRLNEGLANPQAFATLVVRLFKDKLAEHLVRGIQYERINEYYEMTLFETELESWQDHLIRAERSPYDYIEFESEIERQFVEDLNRRTDVHLFIKLPGWFTVPTPVGDYNPDWAIVMQDPADGAKKLYLVRETKGTGELRPTEERKTYCGERHFVEALGVDYSVISSARELP